MPSFTLVLAKRNTVYNLWQEIADQYAPDVVGVPVASQWPIIRVQANPDNQLPNGTPVNILTSTDAQLSGIRHGRVLAPGDIMELNPGYGKFTSTKSIYLLCQDMDGVQVNVDLVGGVGPD